MTSIPWTPEDEEARRLLDERIESYDVDPAAMSWWERILQWLNDSLALNVDPSGAGSVIIQVFLIIAVVILVLFLIRFFRPSVSPATQGTTSNLADPNISAAQYLDRAKQCLTDDQLELAYLHAYRGMVRAASERELTEVTPSTTATVFGWSLGSVLPAYRVAISQATDEFNRISYGGAVPSREATESMLQLAVHVVTAQRSAAQPHQDPVRLMPR